MSVRYVIRDASGRYIMKNAANQYVPVRDLDSADKYDSAAKAKNVLNSCINRNLRKRMAVEEIELPDQLPVSCAPPAIPVKLSSYKPKQKKMQELAGECIQEEDLSLSEKKIMDAIGNMESVRLRKEELQDRHSTVEKEIIDIEHYIELSDGLNAYQGWLAYMMLRKRLKLRRQIKDEIMVLSEVDNIMSGLKKTVSQFNGLANRKYEPRVLTDLFT